MATKFTNSSAHINPIVPHVRIGGKSSMVLSPFLSRPLNATELLSPIVGMKNATEMVYSVNIGPNSSDPPAASCV